ncbi:MAG: aldose 1-epimerase [Thermocladium sp.]
MRTNRFIISNNELRGEVLSLGASLADLRYGSKQIILPYRDDYRVTRAGMAILAPFANRVRNGEYVFNGVIYRLPVNNEGHAIHGFVKDKEWQVIERSDAFISMGLELKNEPGYPFKLLFNAKYEIRNNGLDFSLMVINADEKAAPITVGAHPYFTYTTPRNEWLIDAGDVYRLEAIGNIPTGRMIPQRLVTRVGEYDDCFKINKDEIQLIFSEDWGISIKLRGFHFIQLFTPSWANAVAVEPMTGAPDAFNNGIGLITLGPGKSISPSFNVIPLKSIYR